MRDRLAQFRCWLARRHEYERFGEVADMCRVCGYVRWIA